MSSIALEYDDDLVVGSIVDRIVTFTGGDDTVEDTSWEICDSVGNLIVTLEGDGIAGFVSITLSEAGGITNYSDENLPGKYLRCTAYIAEVTNGLVSSPLYLITGGGSSPHGGGGMTGPRMRRIIRLYRDQEESQ